MKTDNNAGMSEVSFFKKLITILGYVLFLNLFFFHNLGSVSTGLIFLGKFTFFILIFKSFKTFKRDLLPIISVFLALIAFSIGIVIRANLFVQILLGLSSTALLYIFAYTLSCNIPMVRSLTELILSPIYFLLAYIKSSFKLIIITLTGDFKQIGLGKKQTEKNSLVQSLIIGFGLGLFIIGILVSMLVNADPIFASFVKNIVSADFLQNLFLRVFFSGFIGFLLLPYLLLKRKNTFNSPLNLLKKINFLNEMSVIMALVGLVMGVFLIIQWPYVFVKVPFETDLSRFGVATYSEYVRKGFFELLRVSLFVYGLIWTGLIALRGNKTKEGNILRYIQTAVMVEFFVFLFSIFRRIWLYQTYHGWSLVRVYGSFFLLWIFGISIFLALRHFWEKRFVVGEIIFTVLIVFSIGILNVESFIVNSHPPTVNKKIDYVYLSRLSADGYVGWDKAFFQAKETIDKYEFKSEQLNREERKEISYAGIIIRELSKDYKDIIKTYGTEKEVKSYLLSIINFQIEANYKQNTLSNNNQLVDNNNYIKDLKSKVEKNQVNFKKVLDLIHINDSENKYKFSAGSFFDNPSFYAIPAYQNSYFENRIKKKSDNENKDYYLDRLYTWNLSKVNAYKKIVQDERQNELLQLQGKYFQLYMKILSQPLNERDFDMDISLSSPLLD